MREGELRQVKLRREQDESLGQLSSSIERLGLMGRDIHGELEEQGQLLDDVERAVDKTTETMLFVTKQTDALIKKAGGIKWFALIASLAVVALVLFYLVVLF
ncbi:hypothetical protein M885DRAFT_547392 [Pelagophyceae sp. CCMP2097]|nr:hypothetical protein M885DRAFT_547392 [Pelagophyceae sp. CCMP2097]